MKKSNLLFLQTAVSVMMLVGLVLPGVGRAEEYAARSEPLVTQAWMEKALDQIGNRLAAIEENQKKVLAEQEKLSEEHKQLRYWVHRS